MPLFFFPCRDQSEMANRERGKNALQAAFFFSGGILNIPHGEHGEKGLFFKRQRQTATRATEQHRTRGENKPIQARQRANPTDNTAHGENAPKTPEKGDRANAHGGRAGATTAGARRGSPRSADGAPSPHHHAHTLIREGKLSQNCCSGLFPRPRWATTEIAGGFFHLRIFPKADRM